MGYNASVEISIQSYWQLLLTRVNANHNYEVFGYAGYIS